ncbi:TetR/AcrR family transcriptional regulator [Nonomuraea aurantiaca]|jgi:AcrR family transcriptional regulator|uniref:TetR/AcrR family transcriptional regulator n=1 Tax=Nonomuraea aurantiaca TaxID=2878562 RepID=UPI001CD9F7A7|nr:TetR family transcriptional regulator [Nonomuraea aurantiaca]MCA2222442.1 TetR family transcriptional regulator [Nonomuraea aurantiaca]
MARREPLNRAKILDAALELATKEGLEGLSMRRLAKSLGVEAMSLYNHVSNKADILDGLAERAFDQIELPDPALPWPQRLRAVALSMYEVFGRSPVVPMALLTDQSNPTTVRALKPLDTVVGALYEAGFDDAGAWRALGAVNGLLFGSLLLSTGGFNGDFREHAGRQQLGVYIREMDPAQLPHFSRLVRNIPPTDPATDFERALDMLIQGLEQSIPF